MLRVISGHQARKKTHNSLPHEIYNLVIFLPDCFYLLFLLMYSGMFPDKGVVITPIKTGAKQQVK